MKQIKPTRADKEHYENVVDALNDAYIDGKPASIALQLIADRRWFVEMRAKDRLEDRLVEMKRRALKAEEQLAELEKRVADYVQTH